MKKNQFKYLLHSNIFISLEDVTQIANLYSRAFIKTIFSNSVKQILSPSTTLEPSYSRKRRSQQAKNQFNFFSVANLTTTQYKVKLQAQDKGKDYKNVHWRRLKRERVQQSISKDCNFYKYFCQEKMFCSVYFYLKPNEKAAGSASYASLRGGEEGDTLSIHTHSSQNIPTMQKFRQQQHLLWEVGCVCVSISISALFINLELNVGHVSKQLFSPPREKGDFNNTRALLTTKPDQDPHFSTWFPLPVKRGPQVLLWQGPRLRTAVFYSNRCFHSKIQIANKAALLTPVSEMIVVKA